RLRTTGSVSRLDRGFTFGLLDTLRRRVYIGALPCSRPGFTRHPPDGGNAVKYRHAFWILILLALPISAISAQTRIITGRVTDSLTAEVVTAGQVSVGGTTLSTTIKDDGTFTLAVPVRDVTLSLRSIGFKRKDAVF